jgi:hypothetical protein
MLEWIIVGIWLIAVTWFFYKQAIHEFRINQANASPCASLLELWKEGAPLVIRELPRISLWTRSDVLERSCYEHLAIFQDQTLPGWIQAVEGGAICPWQNNLPVAERIAEVTGIPIWAKPHLHPLLGSGLAQWKFVRYHAWAGRVGTRRTYASWTCILPTEGDIVVTLFPETMEMYLPLGWKGGFPIEWSKRDTPFVGDIKYMDVVVRVGTCFFLPPHWFVSWREHGVEGKGLPMVYTVSYHSPVSWMAERMGGA